MNEETIPLAEFEAGTVSLPLSLSLLVVFAMEWDVWFRPDLIGEPGHLLDGNHDLTAWSCSASVLI